MDRRIAPEYRRDYDATGVNADTGGTVRHRHRLTDSVLLQIRLAPFSLP